MTWVIVDRARMAWAEAVVPLPLCPACHYHTMILDREELLGEPTWPWCFHCGWRRYPT